MELIITSDDSSLTAHGLPFEQVARSLGRYLTPIATQHMHLANDGSQSPATIERVHATASEFKKILWPRIVAVLPLSAYRDLSTTAASLTFQLLDDFASIRASKDLQPMSKWRPIAAATFHAAIEAGDVQLVNQIIDIPEFRINIDATYDIIHGLDDPDRQLPVQVTPIQRSCELQHNELTSFLLDRNANINAPPCYGFELSALDFAILGPQMSRKDYNSELIDILLRKHATVSITTLLSCTQGIHTNADVFKKLLFNVVHRPSLESMLMQRVIHRIFRDADSSILDYMIHVLQSAEPGFVYRRSFPDSIWDTEVKSGSLGAITDPFYANMGTVERIDLVEDYDMHRPKHIQDTGFIIDIAAGRGLTAIVQRLRAIGAKTTEDTLVAAIRSERPELVDFLMNNGVKAHCFSLKFRTTRLAEAVKLRRYDLADKIKASGRSDEANANKTGCPELMAIAEVGDIHELKMVLDFRSFRGISDSCFHDALAVSISERHTEVVVTLLEARRELVDSGWPLFDRCAHACYNLDYIKGTREIGRSSVTLIAVAIAHDHQEIIPHLIEHGYLTDDPVIMETAAKYGKFALINELYTLGCDFGRSLAVAVREEHMECVRLLLELGATDNLSCQKSHDDTSHESALTAAMRIGNQGMLSELLKYDIGPCDSTGLVYAVQQQPKTFQDVLETIQGTKSQSRARNANFAQEALALAVSLRNCEYVFQILNLGRIQIDRCCICLRSEKSEHESTLKKLLKISDRHKPDTISVLGFVVLAYEGEDTASIEQLLGHVGGPGVDLNHVAAKYNLWSWLSYRRIAESLWGAGWWLWFNENRGRTALMLAISMEKLALVRLLLERGSNVNTPATRGFFRTPLQEAVEVGSRQIVDLLLEKNADVNAAPAPKGGKTALQAAAAQGYIGIAELLIHWGADVLAPGAKCLGRTALEGAAEHGRVDMVCFLARMAIFPDKQIASASNYALENCHFHVWETLEQLRSAQMPGPVSHQQLENGHFHVAEMPEEVGTAQTPQKRHNCAGCGAKFVTPYGLKRHYRDMHQVPQDAPLRFECENCDYTTTRKDTMERHRARHSKAARVICDECGKDYSRKDYLALHKEKCGR